MKKFLLAVFITVFSIALGSAQPGGEWKTLDKETAGRYGEVKASLVKVTGGFFFYDVTALKQALANAPEKSAGGAGITIAIPDVNGNLERYEMFESSNFAPELQAQFPQIRAYAGNSIENPSAVLRLSLSPLGLSGMVLREAGKTEFIERYTDADNVYIVFNSEGKRQRGRLPFTCLSAQDLHADEVVPGSTARSSDLTFRTYRLALSCTGEYAAYYGGTVAGALAGMNQTMTRVNGVYERDLAIRLTIIANNTAVIYTNAATDPYGNAQPGGNGAWNGQLQATLNTVITDAGYDIGHLFARSGGGGDAGCIGCVCIDGSKGSGFTSPSDGQPQGDSFDIDYVAHELGHQLGGNHTFSSRSENNSVNVEPGSGSTIMGYAGLEGNLDVQFNSDAYFAYNSIRQIQNVIDNNLCGDTNVMGNPALTINAGPAVTIPKGTAFVLRAVTPEANPANTTYCWEQNNDATVTPNSSGLGSNSVVSPTKINGATFRSLPPTTSPDRYMPALQTVVNNILVSPSTWESVSTVARTGGGATGALVFTLTGRDNIAGGGQTKTASVSVSVSGTIGPFTVTSQNTANVSWAVGSSQNVTWNVAGTTAAPVNTANVNIKLSLDGGLTYPVTLASNTANDGSETITVPLVSSTNCRLMVEAVNNIYYALNTTPFQVGIVTSCTSYANNTPLAIPDGSGTSSAINGPIVMSEQVVSTIGTLTDVNITVNATHPSLRDMLLALRHPDGTLVYLWNYKVCPQGNFNINFNDGSPAVVCGTPTAGTYAPPGSLTSLNGKSAAGTWQLMVADGYAGSVGQITSWSLEVCTQQAAASTNDFAMQDLAVYPNPNRGDFTVSFTSGTGQDIKIAVYDMRGRQVMQKSYENTGTFSGNVNLNNAEAGIYLVTIEDGTQRITKKIVVQ